jgi:Fuseless
MTSTAEPRTGPEQAITPGPSIDSSTNSATTNADNMRHDDKLGLNSRRTSPKPPILPGWTCSRFLLLLVDNALCGLVIGPLTVFYWRGTWRLLDHNLVPDIQNRSSNASDDSEWSLTSAPSTLSGWICMVIGNVGLITLVYCQRLLDRWIKVDNVAHWLIGFHLYTYVMGLLNVLHWRGVWLLLDQHTGIGLVSAAVTAAIGEC